MVVKWEENVRVSLAVLALAALVLSCRSPRTEQPSLRVFGNEPFWNVTVSESDGITYQRMGEAEISFAYEPPDHPEAEIPTRVFGPLRDRAGEHEIEIRIREEDCPDTMADMIHPMRATVWIDGEELSGCARRLDESPPVESP